MSTLIGIALVWAMGIIILSAFQTSEPRSLLYCVGIALWPVCLVYAVVKAGISWARR